jgi:hypothetical protein
MDIEKKEEGRNEKILLSNKKRRNKLLNRFKDVTDDVPKNKNHRHPPKRKRQHNPEEQEEDIVKDRSIMDILADKAKWLGHIHGSSGENNVPPSENTWKEWKQLTESNQTKLIKIYNTYYKSGKESRK